MRNFGRIKLMAAVGGLVVAAIVLVVLVRSTSLGRAVTWQRQASPGRLSVSHAFLEDNCAACHTSVRGVEAANCAACHANDVSLLQRQPTAFHADVASCRECHPEHQGGKRPPTTMDHAALAKIGLRQLGDKNGEETESALLRKQLVAWMNLQESGEETALPHPRITPLEAVLNCASCHSNKDRHVKLFGQDCAQCHATKFSWERASKAGRRPGRGAFTWSGRKATRARWWPYRPVRTGWPGWQSGAVTRSSRLLSGGKALSLPPGKRGSSQQGASGRWS
jgi:Class III cytochrome C family